MRFTELEKGKFYHFDMTAVSTQDCDFFEIEILHYFDEVYPTDKSTPQLHALYRRKSGTHKLGKAPVWQIYTVD